MHDKCPTTTNMKNENNSCYLDTILFAMMHDPTSPTCRFLCKLKPQKDTLTTQLVQKELNKVATSFKENQPQPSLAPLRQLLQKIQTSPNALNWTRAQAEPLDFILLLQDVFKVRNCIKFKEEVRAEGNQLVNSRLVRSPFLDLVDASVKKLHTIYPKRVIKMTFDKEALWRKKYKLRKETRTLVSCSKFLMVHVNRLLDGVSKSTEPVTPMSKITMANGTTIYLRSILVHHGSARGGHYTCVYKCKRMGKWYEFDDMKKGVHKQVDNYKSTYNLENATDFIYW